MEKKDLKIQTRIHIKSLKLSSKESFLNHETKVYQIMMNTTCL